MARQKGVVRFTGTIDGLTYYESKYGPLVRKKGGPTKEQFRTDPAFKRSRENAKEFGNCNEAVKTLRAVVMPMMKDARDYQVTARLMKLMAAIKNLDNISMRGERDVAVGILSPAAKDLIVGFDFNDQAPLKKVFRKAVTVNTSTGVISISGLIPEDHLNYTAAATHAGLTGGWARVDFGIGDGELVKTNQLMLPLNAAANNVVLTPASLPSGTGTDFFVLQIVFYQEVNGVLYDLKSGEINAMGVVGMI
jgi:hypothetical protein